MVDNQKDYVNNEKYAFKIMLLGNSSVGKTSFHIRYKDDEFSEEIMPTFGFEIVKNQQELDQNKIAYIDIWDTAGQERFRALSKSYYKNGQAFLLIYSIIDRKSFEDISSWKKDIEEEGNKDIMVMLLGNKTDNEKERQVSTEEGESLAKEYDCRFMEISCKSNINVKEAVKEITNDLYLKYGNNCKIDDQGNRLGLQKEPQKPVSAFSYYFNSWC